MGFQLAITVAYELVSQITYLNAILDYFVHMAEKVIHLVIWPEVVILVEIFIHETESDKIG